MTEEEMSRRYIIIADPAAGFYSIVKEGQMVTATDTWNKIEAIYNALIFAEKLEELAAREEYR